MARGRYGDGAVFEVKSGRDKGRHVARLELGIVDGKRMRWQASSRTAEGALAKLQQARIDFATLGAVSSAMTLGTWMDTWLGDVVEVKCKPRVVEMYRGTVEKWLRPNLGAYPLNKLQASHVRRLVNKISADTSPGNAARVYRVLRACLNVAVKDGTIPRNVALAVAEPASGARRASLTADEARKLVTYLNGHKDRARWLLALFTGARQGECLGLTWDRVDLKAGTIDISEQLQALPAAHGCLDADGQPTCGRKRVTYCPKVQLVARKGFAYTRLGDDRTFALVHPKSDAGQRIVPIPPVLVKALREHRKTGLDNPHGLVFVSPRKRPVSRRVDSMAWDALLKSAKLPDVPLHSARHTTATLLMDLGVPDAVSQQILGHSSIRSGAAYRHADLTMARRAIDELGQAIG